MRAAPLALLVLVSLAPHAAADLLIKTKDFGLDKMVELGLDEDLADRPPARPDVRTFAEDCSGDLVICIIQELPVDEWIKHQLIVSYKETLDLLCVDDAQMSVGTSAAHPGCWYVVERGALNLDPGQGE